MKKHQIYFKKVFICFLFLFSFLYAQSEKVLARIRYDLGSSGEVEYLKVLKSDGNVHLLVNPLDCPTPLCGQDWENMTETQIYDNLQSLKATYKTQMDEQFGNIKGVLRSIYELLSDQENIKVEVITKMPVRYLPLVLFGIPSDAIEIVNSKQFLYNASKENLSLMKFASQIESIELFIEKGPVSGGDEDRSNFPPHNLADPLNSDIIMRSFARSILNIPEGEVIVYRDDNVWEAMEQYNGTGLGVKYSTTEGGKFYEPYVDDIIDYYPFANIQKQNLDIDTNWQNYALTERNSHQHMSFRCGLTVASKSTPYFNKSYADYANLGIQTWSQSTYGADGLEEWAYSPRVFACAPTGNDMIGAVVPLDNFNQLIVGGAEVTWNMYKDEDYYKKYFEIMEEKYYLPFVWGPESELAMTQHGNRYTSANRKYLSDREMPHVVATSRVNGKGAMEEHFQEQFRVNSIDNLFAGIGGTSAAAPSVNGVGACVISAYEGRDTKLEPIDATVENIRVALMVTAENIDDKHWNPLEDGRDGTGVVSGFSAVKFANTVPRFDQGDNAQEHGLAYGQLGDGDESTINLKIKAPIDFTDSEHLNKHLRVVLTWSKSFNDHSGDVEISELDLEVRNASTNEWVSGCYSFEDNHEVVDLEPRQLIPGQEYNLSILVKKLVIGNDPIADHIKYSVGWTWVKDYAGKIVDGNSVLGLNTDHGTIDDNTAKTIVDKNLTLRNRNMRLSKNLTINRPNTTVPVLASKAIQIKPHTRSDQIKLQPGTNSTISLEICELLHWYQFYNYGEVEHNDPTLLDGAGNMDGIRVVEGSKMFGTGPDRRSFIENMAFVLFDGVTYFELNVNEVNREKINPDFKEHTRFSLSARFRLEPEVKDGYIFSATDPTGTEGIYLKIKENGGYGDIEFYIGENSSSHKSITHTLQHDELFLEVTDPNNSSKTYRGSPRVLHITAVWESKNFMKLYVNSVEVCSETSGIPDKYTISGATRYFIGKGPGPQQEIFKGAMGMLRIYAGVLKEKFIKSQFHEWVYPMYPNNGGTDWIDLTLKISGEGNGYIEYGEEYYRKLMLDTEQSGQNQVNYFLGNGSKDHGPYDYKFKFTPQRGYTIHDIEVCGNVHPHDNGEIIIPFGDLYTYPGDKSIHAIIHEIPNYSSKFNYSRGDVIRAYIGNEFRTFECLASNGPIAVNGVQNPHNVTALSEYPELCWIELWWEKSLPYNSGNLVKYLPLPTEPKEGERKLFQCMTSHNSSKANNPGYYQDVSNPWKPPIYEDGNTYLIGDYVLNLWLEEGARLFECIKNNPNSPPWERGEINFDEVAWLEHWVVNMEYKQRDYISYKDNRYVCLQHGTSNLSTNPESTNGSEVWQIFTDWSATTTYNVGEVVMYDNIEYLYPCPKVLYQCKVVNSGNEPDLSPSYWEPFLPSWQEGIEYDYNDFEPEIFVRYNGINYVCIRTHQADQSNRPDISSSTWKRYTDWRDGIYYTSGDLVKFGAYPGLPCETFIYRCKIDHLAEMDSNDPFSAPDSTWEYYYP